MKCTTCHSLNSLSDTVCLGCGKALRRGPAIVQVPWWGCMMALACGVIPGITLGGIVPIALGLGGAAACIKVSSTGILPAPVRFLACVGIAVGCWLVFLGAFVRWQHR